MLALGRAKLTVQVNNDESDGSGRQTEDMNRDEWLEVLLVSCISPPDVVHVMVRGMSSLPLYPTSQVSATPGR